MRSSPSIVSADPLDRDIYLVLEDFGACAGCAWRETDDADTDLETILQNLLSGQYAYPVRIVSSIPLRAGRGMRLPTSRTRQPTPRSRLH
ncbi:hypothetical protein ABIF63_005277 [Bradyrhizobium japonicum]|uniref:Uncharacterized protein n=1 Tax=Bradyrhizobium japonicum TaxID=375 RepID=A0ABV2RW55_BRAJP